MTITRPELYELHEAVCGAALELMKKKNVDYAADSDPFRNFRMFGTFGVVVRMGDKFSRLRSYEENGSLQVKDELIVDTLMDLINYAVIYLGMQKEAAAKREQEEREIPF
jgi:hypothetical protein